MLPAERQIAYNPDDEYPSARGYKMLNERALQMRKKGVHYYSLTHLFKNIEKQTFVDRCCHLNRYGNEVMAREIVRQVSGEQIIKSRGL